MHHSNDFTTAKQMVSLRLLINPLKTVQKIMKFNFLFSSKVASW